VCQRATDGIQYSIPEHQHYRAHKDFAHHRNATAGFQNATGGPEVQARRTGWYYGRNNRAGRQTDPQTGGGFLVTYPSYHELAYLHPDHFQPDPNTVKALGLDPQSGYFIVRFVSWQASHDVGETGLGLNFKKEIVDRLSKHGQVLITSEGALPADLEHLRFQLPVENMHNVMALARMVVGESATMASEAAVLGVPALFISDTGRGYTDDEERLGLVFNFTTQQQKQVLTKLDELLAMPDLQAEFLRRREQMLATKINTTNWIIEYIDQVVAKRND